MSLLELAKRAERQLLGVRQDRPLEDSGHEIDERNETSPGLLHRGDPNFASLVAWLVGLPLNRFALEGSPLEVQVLWLAETLWFVPGEADAEALGREGVSRGRVWTARELMDLLAIPGLTAVRAQTVARAKLEFAGEVVEVRARRRDGERA